jgi:hypothetical protein
MPHPAHFICAHDCRFHLATKVGDYIVSTVGEYWPERVVREIHAKAYDPEWLDANKPLLGDDFNRAYSERFGWMDIGHERKYETMVFKAVPADDAHSCCPWRIDVSDNVDSRGYNDATEAYRGHLELCEKWAKAEVPST